MNRVMGRFILTTVSNVLWSDPVAVNEYLDHFISSRMLEYEYVETHCFVVLQARRKLRRDFGGNESIIFLIGTVSSFLFSCWVN